MGGGRRRAWVPYEVGEAVSAKYRGAWCEGVVKKRLKELAVQVRNRGAEREGPTERLGQTDRERLGERETEGLGEG
jgi:hypothetical protein